MEIDEELKLKIRDEAEKRAKEYFILVPMRHPVRLGQQLYEFALDMLEKYGGRSKD